MNKIVIVNHVFTKEYIRKRWLLFAKEHKDIDLTLISPKNWQYGGVGAMTTGGNDLSYCPKIDDNNYHVLPVEYSIDRTGSWQSTEMLYEIEKIKPQLVYHVGTHLQSSLFPVLKLSKILPNTKFVTFSMRGPNWDIFYNWEKHPIKSMLKFFYHFNHLRCLNNYSDAIICHYPDAIKSFKKEGYKGPIYMCTQVGVDTDVYKPNGDFRTEIRKKYGLGDSFVFGSATRFTAAKGLDDIIEALPKEGDWKYLMIGGGLESDENRLLQHLKARKIENKVIMTGHISQQEMPKYWNAMDCALHTPRTADWIETFSVALVQAMATGLPVIGSDSGSVPYQLGPDALNVKERDTVALKDKILWVLNNQEEAKNIGFKMKWRAEHCFSTRHLNDCIYDIFMDIINDTFDPNKIDQAQYKVPVENLSISK